MTDDRLPVGGVGEDDDGDGGREDGGREDGGRGDGGRDISAVDEQALTDLLASLVADAPAGQISPLEIIKLGRIDRRRALDTRIKRFKVLRNVLVAAAFAGLVVLIVPHLGASSSESAVASSRSSSRSSSTPAPAAAGPGAASAPFAASGSEEEGVAGAGSAAAASGVASGAMSAAASAPTRSGAARPDVVTTSGDSGQSSGHAADSSAASAASGAPAVSGVRCAPLSAGSLVAVTSVFPAGSFGPATAATGCAESGANLPFAGSLLTSTARPGATLVVTVGRAGTGACVPVGCVRRPGANADAYAAPAGSVWVYGNGFQVLLETSGKFVRPPTVDELVDAGRAVITTLD